MGGKGGDGGGMAGQQGEGATGSGEMGPGRAGRQSPGEASGNVTARQRAASVLWGYVMQRMTTLQGEGRQHVNYTHTRKCACLTSTPPG